MNNIKIAKVEKNVYKITRNNEWVIGKFPIDYSIDLNNNISEDNIIFIKNVRPIPEEDTTYVMAGDCYRYEDNKCVERFIIGMDIIDTNVDLPTAQNILYDVFLTDDLNWDGTTYD